MNVGADTIVIKKLFIDGVVDNGYLVDGVVSADIIKGQVVRITPSLSGSEVTILTENKKSFNFGF